VPQSGQPKSVVPFSTSSVSPQPAQRTSTASGGGGGVAIGWEKGKEVSLGFLGTLSCGLIAHTCRLQRSNFTFYSIFVSIIVCTPTP
jgi:hypothetical protein